MQVDRDAPLRFLRSAFQPDDWIAVLLKRHDTGEAVQRVGPVDMVLDERFQGWLRFKNAHRFDVFVSINALTPGRRSRTRESVTTVRHIFLDADHDADRVLGAISRRSDVPAPSVVVHSSKGRAHVLWRVEGMSVERAEALQKQLARELDTDRAATSTSQMTRLPGFWNYKYAPPQCVVVEYGPPTVYTRDRFPEAPAVVAVVASNRYSPYRRRLTMLDRARSYLKAVPPAIAGASGDAQTFRVCCRLLRHFGLSQDEALEALAEWNSTCRPPWSARDLAVKVRSARRTVG